MTPDRGDPRKYVLPDPERMPKAGVPPPPGGSDRMTPDRLTALRMLAREPLRPDDPARQRDLQAGLQDALDEIGRLTRERDALVNLCIVNVNDHFARGDEDRWDGYLNHFEVDPRADPWASFDPECEVFWRPHGSRKAAVAALRRAAGIGEDVP